MMPFSLSHRGSRSKSERMPVLFHSGRCGSVLTNHYHYDNESAGKLDSLLQTPIHPAAGAYCPECTGSQMVGKVCTTGSDDFYGWIIFLPLLVTIIDSAEVRCVGDTGFDAHWNGGSLSLVRTRKPSLGIWRIMVLSPRRDFTPGSVHCRRYSKVQAVLIYTIARICCNVQTTKHWRSIVLHGCIVLERLCGLSAGWTLHMKATICIIENWGYVSCGFWDLF